jgi:hypothetical protein
MEKTEKEVEIPLPHFVIRQNIRFMDELANRIRSGRWTFKDLKEFLERCGYRRDTANRFIRGVEIRLQEDTEGNPASGALSSEGEGVHPAEKKEISRPRSKKRGHSQSNGRETKVTSHDED